MADNKLTFESANAKDTNFNSEVEAAEKFGVTATNKGVVNVPSTATMPAAGLEIDVSASALFKTVSVESGYSGKVTIDGNGTVANTFYAGGGGAYMYGGDPGMKNDKPVVAADKFYGGAGKDTYVYAANGGKDAIYNYADGDVVVLKGYTDSETQSLSFVDKSGGIVVTVSDSADSTVSKNSVLTVDGKTATQTGGFKFVDEEGNDILTYGQMVDGVAYLKKNGKDDTTTLNIANTVSGTVNTGIISSTVKNISVIDDTDTTSEAVYIVGNGNANKITLGAGGGTVDGGTGAKSTADVLYGNASAEVVFIYDAKTGGKDTIGDAKLTQYNYKDGDKIVITNGDDISAGNLSYKGTDVVVSVDSANILTIKNALGKAINIYDLTEDDDGNVVISDEPMIDPWGETLSPGLVYDSKLSKITADDAVITAKGPTDSKTVLVTVGSVTIDEIEYPTKIDSIVSVYSTIKLGGEDEEEDMSYDYAETVKEIDLSASSAPVYIDTSDHASVTSIKVGKGDSTVLSNEEVTQSYTAGAGEDTFVISANKLGIEKFKGETITNMGSGDILQIADLDSDDVVSVTEKGKDLIVAINGTTFVTLKNASFDANNKLKIQDETGKLIKEYPFTVKGVGYGTNNKGAEDKTTITLGGAVGSATVNAEDFGGATVKKIDATAVTSVSGNKGIQINGSSAANTMFAPNASVKIATTLDGGTGNDAYNGGAGTTYYVFHAQTKGKKDTITDYKTGDVIVIDQESLESSAQADIDATGIFYNESVDGFNDSKSDVVISVNKSNTITVKNGAGQKIILADGIGGATYGFGHVLPSTSLNYDSKNTAVTLKNDAAYNGDIDLMDSSVYYSTIKKVDLSNNTLTANIYGNTLANELIAGSAGGILDGGAITDEILEATANKAKPTADRLGQRLFRL